MSFSFLHQNPVNLVQHADALRWRSRLTIAHGVGWLADYEYYAAMQAAVHQLFEAQAFPDSYTEADLWYERDLLGKPFITWRGTVGTWAEERGLAAKHLHVSNTHDGGAHVVIAAYHPDMVGIGIDAVYLPRLMQSGKDEVYQRRFAARFMSERERIGFEQASGEDTLEELRLRAAAHFSLMEAGSKALGTGLKIGGGMGRETSLPKQSIGVQRLEPRLESNVEMLFEREALARLAELDAVRAEAYWSADDTFLISVVLLWRRVQ